MFFSKTLPTSVADVKFNFHTKPRLEFRARSTCSRRSEATQKEPKAFVAGDYAADLLLATDITVR